MKKLFCTALIGASVVASAQVTFSGKANLLFPTQDGTWKNTVQVAQNAYEAKGKNNVGFNVGLSAKIDFPTALFIMPEIYYTSFTNEFTDSVTNTTIEAKSSRVDVPVLLGYNVLGKTLGAFIGPVMSYNLAKDNTYNDFVENVKNNFTVGYQFGAQVQIKKLIINARYEGAFTKDQRDFTNSAVSAVAGDYVVRYDSRPSMLILGVGYAF